MSTVSQLAYRNFVETCKSATTRKTYLMSLYHFMDYLKIGHDQYDKLIEKDPKIIQMDICNYITWLKSRGIAFATISLYVAAIQKFCTMNDIILNWKKIKNYIGEHEKVAEDRPYLNSEIQTLIHNTSQRNRGIIMLMASAGESWSYSHLENQGLRINRQI